MKTKYQSFPSKPVRAVTGCFLGSILFIILLALLQASSDAGRPAAAAPVTVLNLTDTAQSSLRSLEMVRDHVVEETSAGATDFQAQASNVELVGSYNVPGGAFDVVVQGDYAYVAAGPSGLAILNVANSAAPTATGFYTTDNGWGVAVAGNYAYLADISSGLYILNVTNPAVPNLVGSYFRPGQGGAHSASIVGNLAYVAAAGALQILDVSNPATPSLLGSYAHYAWDVAVVGNLAYVAVDQGGLLIIDVTDPTTPTLVSSYDEPGSALGVEVIGSLAYLTTCCDGLQIIDVSDPTSPHLQGSFQTPEEASASDVMVVDNYAYVAFGRFGLRVVDISDPTSPQEVGFYDTPGYAYDVFVTGGYIYLADGEGGLLILRYSGAGEVQTFEDDFDGTAVDSTKWNTGIAVTGKRWCSTTEQNHHSNPGEWLDVTTEPCHDFTQTPPYGVITVMEGQASFSAGTGRTFPYIWAGPPSRPSPFPSTRDFILEVRMKYNSLPGSGDGLSAVFWENTDPVGSNPPAGRGGVFGIWGDLAEGLATTLVGERISVSNPLVYHDYRLEYISGEYSLFIDGVLRAGPIASSLRPNTIWIGNPVFTHWGISDWSDFTIDFVRVTVPTHTSIPASQGFLRLSGISSSYTPAQPIAPTVRVDNPTGATHSYTVTVSLLQGSSVLDTLPWGLTVPGGESETKDFNFGARPPGIYLIKAELKAGGNTLATKMQGMVVFPSDAQISAEAQASVLTNAAQREFDQVRDLVTDVLADSEEEAAKNPYRFMFDRMLDESLDQFLAAYGVPEPTTAKTVLSALFDPVKDRVTQGEEEGRGFREQAKAAVNQYVDPQRERVKAQKENFATAILSKEFSWNWLMNLEAIKHSLLIAGVVETKPYLGVVPGYPPFGPSSPAPTTLFGEWLSYRLARNLPSTLGVVFVAVAVLVLAVAFGWIAVPASLAGVFAAAKGLLEVWKGVGPIMKYLTPYVLLWAAAVMNYHAEHTVVPAITQAHQDGLQALLRLIDGGTGTATARLETRVHLAGQQPTFATTITNTGNQDIAPLVQMDLYTADGRLVDILSAQPGLRPGQTRTLSHPLGLPPGHYKAVSAIHSGWEMLSDISVTTFDVVPPPIQLDTWLNRTQLQPGEALQATMVITNTDPLTGTGELILMAQSSDGQNADFWPISLDPESTLSVNYRFVPQQPGGYVLRVSLTNGTTVLATSELGYVVGDGATLALEISRQQIYAPGIDAQIVITATNAGNLPTSTVLSLVTFDRLSGQAGVVSSPVYSQTLPLSVAPTGSSTVTATVLPQAPPGQYRTQVWQDSALRRTWDFEVAAEDTLFGMIEPDNVNHSVGDTVTLTVQVMNSVYTYTDALVDVTLWRPDGITQTVTMNPVGTGQYQGTVTAPITGTYLAAVEVSKPNYRAFGNSTFFVAGERSQLLPTVDGRPILGTTQPVTVTVRNEQGTPIVGASLVVSGTLEYLTRQTDEAGQAVLQLSPTITEPYQISLEKLGFAQTLMDLPVWVAPDTTPPPLFLDAPSITNRTPLTVTGLTEAGAGLTLNSQPVAVDAQGRFTTTVALSEGANTLEAAATDAAGNTATLTCTVTLDTVPPALAVTDPEDGLFSLQEVISVTGSTEVGASVIVSSTTAGVDPSSGEFNAWLLLQPGVNTIPVSATDAAGNTTTVTRTVAYSCVFGDFDGNRQVDAPDVQAVATRWRKAGEPLYDFDRDGVITVADIMRVAAVWGSRCP